MRDIIGLVAGSAAAAAAIVFVAFGHPTFEQSEPQVASTTSVDVTIPPVGHRNSIGRAESPPTR